MKQKIYGIFSNVDDAKQAFGSIKKETLNQVDLTIVFANGQESYSNHRKDNYEFAAEYISESPRNTSPIWPGLKEENLAGIGKIQIGSINSERLTEKPEHSHLIQLAGEDLGVIEREVQANKVVAIIEAEPDLLPKLRLILETNGAEIIAAAI